MYSIKNTNSPINELIRKAVRAEIKCGRNWMGATAALAACLGVHPDTVRMRYRDLITGTPRLSGVEEKCWRFLASIAERERLWIERLARDVEQRRDALQLTLPLDGETLDEAVAGRLGAAANRMARAESELARARRAMGAFDALEAQANRRRAREPLK